MSDSVWEYVVTAIVAFIFGALFTGLIQLCRVKSNARQSHEIPGIQLAEPGADESNVHFVLANTEYGDWASKNHPWALELHPEDYAMRPTRGLPLGGDRQGLGRTPSQSELGIDENDPLMAHHMEAERDRERQQEIYAVTGQGQFHTWNMTSSHALNNKIKDSTLRQSLRFEDDKDKEKGGSSTDSLEKMANTNSNSNSSVSNANTTNGILASNTANKSKIRRRTSNYSHTRDKDREISADDAQNNLPDIPDYAITKVSGAIPLLKLVLNKSNAIEYVRRTPAQAFQCDTSMVVTTSNGDSSCDRGGWIIINQSSVDESGMKGDVFTMSDDDFKRAYEPVPFEDNLYRKRGVVYSLRVNADYRIRIHRGSSVLSPRKGGFMETLNEEDQLDGGIGEYQCGKAGSYLIQYEQGHQQFMDVKSFTGMYTAKNAPQYSLEMSARQRFHKAASNILSVHKSTSPTWQVPPPVTNEISEALSSATNNVHVWDFDVFFFQQLTQGRPLYYMSMYLFEYHDLVNYFSIDRSCLANFLAECENTYLANPYHNSTHAADVLQAVHFLLEFFGLQCALQVKWNSMEVFALILSAIIHDIAHPGTNNFFHIKTSSLLALCYNDKSVLEHFHCSTAFTLLRQDQFNIFKDIPEPTYRQIRAWVTDMVLATDLAEHQGFIKTFTVLKQKRASLKPKHAPDNGNGAQPAGAVAVPTVVTTATSTATATATTATTTSTSTATNPSITINVNAPLNATAATTAGKKLSPDRRRTNSEEETETHTASTTTSAATNDTSVQSSHVSSVTASVSEKTDHPPPPLPQHFANMTINTENLTKTTASTTSNEKDRKNDRSKVPSSPVTKKSPVKGVRINSQVSGDNDEKETNSTETHGHDATSSPASPREGNRSKRSQSMQDSREDHETKDKDNTTTSAQLAPLTVGDGKSTSTPPATFTVPLLPEERVAVMKLILKMGDISHPSRMWRLHKQWTNQIMEEFFQQGDREKALGMPASQMMDRKTTEIPKSQVGFIQFLVQPTYQTALEFSQPSWLPSDVNSHPIMKNIGENINNWKNPNLV